MRGVETFDSIQGLRAVAALSVVGYHVQPRLERLGWHGYWPEWLAVGVDVFFVISGFIMWTTASERNLPPLQFVMGRLVRIAPLYWIVTALTVVLLAFAPQLVASGRFDPMHAAASFAFFPSLHPVLQVMEPVVPQGWTLNTEMEFYALFALALFLSKRARVVAIPLALVALCIVGRSASPQTALGFYTSGIILEFGFGVLLGVAVAAGWRAPSAVALAALAAGAVALPATWPLVLADTAPRWLAAGLPAALVVVGAVGLELNGRLRPGRGLLVLGDASYAIYLVHGLFLTAFSFVWARAGLTTQALNAVAFAILAFVVAVSGGVAVHYAVERPMTKALRRVFLPPGRHGGAWLAAARLEASAEQAR
jgi:peptidoglycan/LPS O-acetylase OafA/YrhL